MAEKNIIGCCDTTDHGGRVLEGYALMRLDNGHRVAGKGHMVFCPQCNGIFPIEGGVPSLFGYAPAVEGMRTTCGARLIASQNRETLDDEADAATNQRSAPALSESTNTAPISAPPAGTGVSSAAFAVTRPPAEDPVHVVIRIALCDDGTGNNYPNSKAAIEKCSPQAAGLDKHPAIIDQLMAACRKQNNMNDVSYAGGETNVHRLHDLYPEMYRLDETVIGQDGRRYVYLRAYIEGIGTRADHKDSLFTFGTGFGPTGVIACAEKAVEAAVAQISRFLAMNPNIIIDATEFDLFGFSRGAASSRHVVSLILHGGDQGVMARQLREAGLPLKDGWSGGNKSDLRIRFVGLYESVAAIGIPDNGNNDPVKLHLSDDCADHVVHLTARDECRENFCLNRVKLSRYIEIALPGVHSDLGGGYSMLGWEQSVLTRPEISLENLDQEKYDFATSRELKEMLKVYLDKVATGSTAVKRTLDQLREAEKLDKDWLIDSELNPPPNSTTGKCRPGPRWLRAAGKPSGGPSARPSCRWRPHWSRCGRYVASIS